MVGAICRFRQGRKYFGVRGSEADQRENRQQASMGGGGIPALTEDSEVAYVLVSDK